MSLSELFVPTVAPLEVILRATFVYAVLLALFRVFGRAQQARHAGFDIVVLFLVGTALRKTIVADDESLTSGAIGILTLFALDWLASLLTWRNRRVSLVLEGRPIQIVKDGEPIDAALRRTRLNRHEVREHLREKGTEDLSRVRAAFVERDGKVTFLMRD
ncbi:MAG TPA: YetF domain-containing protein [Anaeromyxobacter sp.]|nr:YetF domain-containing protein [Anaeromyxobacter sp.]